MPKVPTYDQPMVQESQGPQVRLNAQPSLESLGGGESLQRLAGTASNLAMQTAKIYQEEKNKADQLAVLEARTALEKKQQDLLYNPQTGAFGRKGKNAFNIQDEFGSGFDSHADELESSLNNDDQRLMFKQIRMKMRGDLDQSLGKHIFQETQRYDDETTNAAFTALGSKAELNYKDPAKINEAITEAGALFESYAARKGYDGERTKTEKQALLSKMHSGVINRYLSNDEDVAANNYYQLVKGFGQIAGQDAVNLENKLKDGSSRGESQRQSDAILSKAGNNFEQAIKMAEKIEDPKIRDLTVSRIEHKASQTEAMKRQTQNAAAQAGDDILKKTGGDINELMKSPYWDQMSTALQQDKIKMSRMIREGIEPVTDQKKFYDLQLMAADPKLQGSFLKMNLYEMRSQFNEKDYDYLVKLQTGIKSKDDKTLSGLKDIRSKDEIFKSKLASFGIDPTPKEKTQAADQRDFFLNLIGEQQSTMQKQLGRELSNDEFAKLVDKTLLEKRKVKGWLWGSNEKEIKDININKNERRMIIEELNRAGKSASERNILELYLLKNKPK